MQDEPMVNVLSPEDPVRAQAIEAGERAKALAAQVSSMESTEWVQSIEPVAQDYYNATKQAEKALLLSIAISTMRLSQPAPVARGEAQDVTDAGGFRGWPEEEPVRGTVAKRSTRGKSADNTYSPSKSARTRAGKRYGSGSVGRKQPRKHK
jgi:hypothetical protein